MQLKVTNCYCQSALTIDLDWTFHRHGLYGIFYSHPRLRKRVHLCTCYTLSMCDQVTSRLAIQEGSPKTSNDQEVNMEQSVAKSIVETKIQVQEKFWRVFVAATTLGNTLVELQLLCLGQLFHGRHSSSGMIDSQFRFPLLPHLHHA